MEVADLSYLDAVDNLKAAQRYGLCGVEVQKDRLVPTSGLSFMPLTVPFREPFKGVVGLVEKAVQIINAQHQRPAQDWSDEEIAAFFDAEKKTFDPWNSHASDDLKISNQLWAASDVFDPELFDTYYLSCQLQPLIVSPKKSMFPPEFRVWAIEHRKGIRQAMQKYGAIFYRGFSVQPKEFPDFFEAATGSKITAYQGDSPRNTVDSEKHVAESTRVDPGSEIPPHQEDAGHATMADDIGFFCVEPSQEGTGETGFVDARKVSQMLAEKHPELWEQLCTRTVNYTACYYPDDKWTCARALNSSQATMREKFGTDDIEEIKRRYESPTCEIRKDDAGRVFVTRKDVPAVQFVDGKPIFCNQIHFHKLTPELTGGQLQNRAAHWLYPEEARQYDARWSNGEEIPESVASTILNVLKACQTDPISWEAGEVRIYDNRLGMHSKRPHSNPWLGSPRLVYFVGGKRQETDYTP